MRRLFSVGVVAAVAVVYGFLLFAAPVWADIPFAGSGTSGTGLPTGPGETWTYNASSTSSWGSPGVGLGTTTYDEVLPARGVFLSFDTGATVIDTSSFTFPGSLLGCIGGTGGGTVFCDTTAGTGPWTPVSIGTGSMEFLAPSGTLLHSGDHYFGNVFFTTEASTTFSGSWLTVPEPGTISLFSMGFLGLGLIRIRFRKVA